MTRRGRFAIPLILALGTGLGVSGEPGPDLQAAVDAAHAACAGDDSGAVADYIPALASVDPAPFGIAVVTVDGRTVAAGDAGATFAIMSAAKPFTLALVLEQHGIDVVIDRIGVEPTGLPFNSLRAIELYPQRSVNPLVNAGALAAVSLIRGDDPAARWKTLLAWYGRFAGRRLELMPAVYDSLRPGGTRNRAAAYMLLEHGRLYGEPEAVRDVYNRQSSVGVTTKDLAMMGAVLANGGVHPAGGERVLDAETVEDVLAVMMMAGMYDGAGRWAVEVGLPAKSGVGGGIVAVVPGEMAIAAFSPRLDEHGNSVRAAAAIGRIADSLELGLFETGR